MSWNKQLGKDWKGSRPRCVLFMDGEQQEVADRLTELVGLPDVSVSAADIWMPYGKPIKKEDGSWDNTPTNEIQLDKENCLVSSKTKEQLGKWWLAVQTTTPNWDIASTCRINDQPGLILIEAKAHESELTNPTHCGSGNCKNLKQITKAISQANRNLQDKTKSVWNLSPNDHYQLSNRFAWSWKLASLGIPVILLYLGFLNADEMSDHGQVFHSKEDWERVLKTYCKDKINNACWKQRFYFNNTPLIPLIRSFNQPFDPKNP